MTDLMLVHNIPPEIWNHIAFLSNKEKYISSNF